MSGPIVRLHVLPQSAEIKRLSDISMADLKKIAELELSVLNTSAEYGTRLNKLGNRLIDSRKENAIQLGQIKELRFLLQKKDRRLSAYKSNLKKANAEIKRIKT